MMYNPQFPLDRAQRELGAAGYSMFFDYDHSQRPSINTITCMHVTKGGTIYPLVVTKGYVDGEKLDALLRRDRVLADRMEVSAARQALASIGYETWEASYTNGSEIVARKRMTLAQAFPGSIEAKVDDTTTIPVTMRITIEQDGKVSRKYIENIIAAIKPQDTVQSLAKELAENYLAATRGEIFNPDALAFVKRCREAKE